MVRCLLIALLALNFNEADAKKLYKFQDERGVLHYSDAPPANIQPLEIRQLKAVPKRRVWLEKAGSEKQPEFYIRNNYFGPIEVEISFAKRKNVIASPELPRRFNIAPGLSRHLFQIRGFNVHRGWSFTLQYQYMVGSSQARHDANAVYLPPIASGAHFQVSQAFNGEFSHHDAQNRYAVDIVMPIGTPVYAARSGIVMEVENDYFKGGTDNKAYRSRANSIRILHADGSMAVYAHLQLEKAQVYPGSEVHAGQLIAYSGNTGYSSGPHLHFAVQLNRDMTLVSVPFMFSNESGTRFIPKSGMWLSRGLAPADS